MKLVSRVFWTCVFLGLGVHVAESPMPVGIYLALVAFEVSKKGPCD